MPNTSFKKRVAVLRGGPSLEYEISMQTGEGVIKALSGSQCVVKDITISKSGEWLLNGFVKQPMHALLDVDVVFVALHGDYGEDGVVQRVLERLSIPYTGSGPYASALAMNKVLTKEHIKKYDSTIKMAPHMKLTKSSIQNILHVTKMISESFGPEYFIKPVSGGSSIGTVLANQASLFQSITASLEKNDEIVVEKRIKGKEATVGILENFRGQKYYQLPAIEIIPPATTTFFSAEVKYTGETEEICPGRFSKNEKEQLLENAQTIHTALGLRQYSRSDFIVADDGIYFLEVNTLPGLTEQSLFPKSMVAVGSDYSSLVTHLIETA